jgi:hypothetical protein
MGLPVKIASCFGVLKQRLFGILDFGLRIAELEISPLFELLLISIQNPKSAIRNLQSMAVLLSEL